jgi:hypothetical protein
MAQQTNGMMDVTKRQLRLVGLAPLMFDRYAGDNKTQLPPESKMYFMGDGKTLCLPSANIFAFLSAKNTDSVAKIVGGKTYKSLANALLSFVQIFPDVIPITRNGKPIVFSGFIDGRDADAKIYIDRRVARLDKGIPNPKERPVVEMDWEVSFGIRIFKNEVFDEVLLKTAFQRGGLAMGLGTYRGVFGKFSVDTWE